MANLSRLQVVRSNWGCRTGKSAEAKAFRGRTQICRTDLTNATFLCGSRSGIRSFSLKDTNQVVSLNSREIDLIMVMPV